MAKSGIARTIEKITGGQSKKERKEIDDYGENDEYKSRKKHIYKEDQVDSIYCPLLFQRRGKENHAGKD